MAHSVGGVPAIADLSDGQLLQLRGQLEREMKRRGLGFSVGEIGERLVIEHFNSTPGLPGLQIAPPGTKNVDALSRQGDRYSIKTAWKSKKTGTIYPDPIDKDKRLFEYLLLSTLDDNFALKGIHQLDWDDFLAVRSWDKRMSAWYVARSSRSLKRGNEIYSRPT